VSALQLKHNIFSKTKIENSKDIVETERDMRGSFMYTYDSTTTLGPVKLPSNSVLEEEYIKQAHLILDRDGISPLLHTVEMESDCCTDFGAFSRLYTSCSAKAASKICSADTLALIDDAIMSVTNRVQKQQDIASFTSKYYASSECLFSNDRIQWRRLTGSSEIIVALGFIEMEPSKLEGVVHIRIINASGFKIPEFNLHMTSSSGASLSPFQNYTASGAEYFLPDAIVDRTFRFNISSFEPTNLVLRIIFPGLVKDPLDHAPMYQMSASSKDGRRDKQELFSAAISCIPITLPAHALLQPYGASSLFSVRQLYEPLSPLMPYDIWTAAWARLQKSVGVEVVSFIEIPSSGSFSEALVHTLKKRQKLYLSGSFDINMDTLVNNSEFSGETESRSTICWLFQSLWGHEIAVRMQLYRQSAPVRERGTWKGLIDLRGDNMDVLNALENDIERF
jgi:hypothetical protein